MGYRDPTPPEPQTVPYARFAASKSEGLFFVLTIVLGLGMLVGATHRRDFRCDRRAGEVRCEQETSLLWQVTGRRSFEGDQLSSVEFQPYSGNKGKEMGRTDLFDAHGNPTAVLRAPLTEASEHHTRLRAFLDDSTQQQLEIGQPSMRWAGLITGALALLWAFFIGRAFVRTSGHFEVVVDAVNDTIIVRARHLGFIRSERVHPLAGLVGIGVEQTFLKRTKHGRGAPGEPAAQLRLDYEAELPRKLTATPLPGSGVHEDLAERLREVTGLTPETRPAGLGDDAAGDAKRADPAEKKQSRTWLILVFAGPLIAIGVVFGLQATLGESGGRVLFQVEQRCKFQGAELLPGAEMSTVLDPGTYSVELFDPEAPGMWRTDTFTVTEGQARSYVCR